MNTRSSTEVEVVAADKIISPMIWTQLFLAAQGYPVKENILYQDNKAPCCSRPMDTRVPASTLVT